MTRGLPSMHFLAKQALSKLLLLCLVLPVCLHAANITGTVKDPSGAVIPGARLEITGEGIAQPIVLVSDGLGKFVTRLETWKI